MGGSIKPNLREFAEEILHDTFVMSLATVDDDGPWVADIIFTWDDNLNIYWMSKDWRRHSRALELNPQVAATITSTRTKNDPENSLQIAGRARQVKEIPRESIVKLQRKRGKDTSSPHDDILGEHEWYQLQPSKIELLYEPEFGYERQTLK